MRSFEYLDSIARATLASFSFRTRFFSREMRSGKMFRASCMVIVEKPWLQLCVRTSLTIAAGTRFQSTPACS